MSNYPHKINEDGTITLVVSRLGVPSHIDGRIYTASDEVIEKFNITRVGKVVGTFGHPDLDGIQNVDDFLLAMETVNTDNAIGILVDTDLKSDTPSITVDPVKRLRFMVESKKPLVLGIRTLTKPHRPGTGVLEVTKLISYDIID